MRCYICDRALEEPQFNSDHDDYEPCESCLVVISDTLEGYKDQAAAEEDELGTDDLFHPSWKPFLQPDDDFT